MSHRRPRTLCWKLAIVVVATVVGLVSAGCGSSNSGSGASPAASTSTPGGY